MTAKHVTYADLDALLLGLGFRKRSIEVDHGRADDRASGMNGASADQTQPRLVVPGIAYEHEKSGALVLLPAHAAEDAADRYLVPARHALLDRGVITNEEWDRWLCQTRFPDACGAALTTKNERMRATG
jgi:hypothetical protein